MAVNNSLVKRSEKKLGISAYLSQEAVKDQINRVLGGDAGKRFISAVVSAVTLSPALQECSNASILSAALLGESLGLSPSPQLGQYYMVPRWNGKKKVNEATFQLGYKGYIQLAIRSAQYRKINVLAIKAGELEYFDPLNEEIKVNLRVESWDDREKAETVGYYAMFELVNGFRKSIYWSRAQMAAFAEAYSPAYAKDLEKGTDQSFWAKNFDAMAYKTMLRQLISKWGVMSIEMQQAYVSDEAVIDEGGSAVVEVEHVEGDPLPVVAEVAGSAEDPEPSDAMDALFGQR